MFSLVKINDGRINQPEPEFLPVGATAVTKGEALVLSSGKLVAAAGTTKPTFIAMTDGKANEAAVPACRIRPEQLWETAFSASAGEGVTIAVGSKVTLASGGVGVTATTTSGVATVVDLLGAENAVSDATVYVRFE